jgi:hypothetical protein
MGRTMKFTVRPRHDSGHGNFSVAAAEPREALSIAKDMLERGVKDVEILDENGTAYDLTELERVTKEVEETSQPRR